MMISGFNPDQCRMTLQSCILQSMPMYDVHVIRVAALSSPVTMLQCYIDRDARGVRARARGGASSLPGPGDERQGERGRHVTE